MGWCDCTDVEDDVHSQSFKEACRRLHGVLPVGEHVQACLFTCISSWWHRVSRHTPAGCRVLGLTSPLSILLHVLQRYVVEFDGLLREKRSHFLE